jgi:hypothetical protein
MTAVVSAGEGAVPSVVPEVLGADDGSPSLRAAVQRCADHNSSAGTSTINASTTHGPGPRPRRRLVGVTLYATG